MSMIGVESKAACTSERICSGPRPFAAPLRWGPMFLLQHVPPGTSCQIGFVKSCVQDFAFDLVRRETYSEADGETAAIYRWRVRLRRDPICPGPAQGQRASHPRILRDPERRNS